MFTLCRETNHRQEWGRRKMSIVQLCGRNPEGEKDSRPLEEFHSLFGRTWNNYEMF
jgi:hypothetical protein